jgi:hypothetical protein
MSGALIAQVKKGVKMSKGKHDDKDQWGIKTGNIIVADTHLVDRRTSKAMPYWDAIMILSLVYAATVTPFEVVYLADGPCVTRLFVVNRVVDLLFVLDIVLTFNLIELDPTTGKWMYKRRLIARRYFRTWFCVDFVSVLPFWVSNWLVDDADSFDCSSLTSSTVVLGEADAAGAASAVRMLRLVRSPPTAAVQRALPSRASSGHHASCVVWLPCCVYAVEPCCRGCARGWRMVKVVTSTPPAPRTLGVWQVRMIKLTRILKAARVIKRLETVRGFS